MTNKKKLKDYLILKPYEKRIELEEFIDSVISDNDVYRALKLIEEHEGNYRVSDLSYSDSGDFNIKLETGITYKK